ncbi:MAG: hypothetical protein AAFY15_13700, partial [Cyanobacteria bacterium J06648_11]
QVKYPKALTIPCHPQPLDTPSLLISLMGERLVLETLETIPSDRCFRESESRTPGLPRLRLLFCNETDLVL